MNYLFTIFHRLNTGGSKLSNQEIRNCIFNGTFNSFLKNAASNDIYLSLFDIESNKIDRFSNEELILRFISFTFNMDAYKGQLARFLNEFMETNKNPPKEKIEEFTTMFNRTIKLIFENILDNSPLPQLSKATTEALFVGVAKNIDGLENQTNDELKDKYHALRNDTLFSVESLKEGLAQKDRVLNRLNRAIEIFS
jgi:hypothetical protein